MTQSVVAITEFEFKGVAVHPGDTLDVRPIEAAALTYQRKAVFPHQYTTRDMVAVTKPRRRRRAYKRRDLTAESSS